MSSLNEETDRTISRRVDNPTAAAPGDDRVHDAADPTALDTPDTDPGGTGGAAERAAADLDSDDESEPTRSE
jgi:hypothetical protein